MLRRPLSIIVFIILATQSLWAAISVELNPREPRVGEVFTLDIIFSGVPDAKKGDIDFQQQNLAIQSRQWDEKVNTDIFGRRGKRTAYSFKVKALESGIQTIKSFTWTINGKPIHLDANLQVNIKRSFESPGLLLYPLLSKKSVYLGEQFRYTLDMNFYENYQGNLTFKKENFGTDFWAHKNSEMKLEKKRPKPPFVESALLKYAFLSPTKAGPIPLPTIELSYTKEGPVVREERKNQAGGASFFFSSTQQKSIEATAKTPQVTIEVKELPEKGKPQDFNGLVGQYTFSSLFDKTTIDMGDALTLTITMSGNGRPGAIPNPALPDFSEFRTVPPESKTTTKEINGLIKTTKTITYFLYPKRTGVFNLEAITFHYFDPAKRKYVVLSSGEINITVNKSEIEGAPLGGQQLLVQSQDRIRSLGSDIRHIKLESSQLHNDGAYLYTKVWYWIALLFMATPLVFVVLLKKYMASVGTNVVKKRRGRARTQAAKRLKQAYRALNTGDTTLFYSEISTALLSFLSDKLSIEFIGLTYDSAQEELGKRKVAPQQLKDFTELMSQCDRARFSSLSMSIESMQADIEKTDQLLKMLEKEL